MAHITGAWSKAIVIGYLSGREGHRRGGLGGAWLSGCVSVCLTALSAARLIRENGPLLLCIEGRLPASSILSSQKYFLPGIHIRGYHVGPSDGFTCR